MFEIINLDYKQIPFVSLCLVSKIFLKNLLYKEKNLKMRNQLITKFQWHLVAMKPYLDNHKPANIIKVNNRSLGPMHDIRLVYTVQYYEFPKSVNNTNGSYNGDSMWAGFLRANLRLILTHEIKT